ncbi:hypothetical protein [Marinivivus vitaminiproducens]|uniref:hypothetical protein n=1 Tax=Marinivivus vitaminiproducens TaxID=3035935 RepID=UPI00279FFF0F|nr:hypothetical protein P4R82_24620 [Geminicoccaceae bacterium SCSIO 64248]
MARLGSFGGSALALTAVLFTAAPALAGDELGISDAGSIFAEALATLGIVMSIAGLAIAGFLMATNFFLALTVGGSLLVGGTIMALSEDGASALWGADLGGGSSTYYTGPQADAGDITFDPATGTATLSTTPKV